MRTLTMSELEQVTGVPRGTIYHYIKEGLIPPSLDTGHKTGVYTEEHAQLLTQIRRLRRHRVPLPEIEEHLRRSKSGRFDDDAQVAARRDNELRIRILDTAVRRFSQKGYRKTGVDEIIAELEIAPGTLYRFFPTKRDLFIQSIRHLVTTPQPGTDPEAQPGKGVSRTLSHARLLLTVAAASEDVMVAARAEALGEDEELEQLVEQAYAEWLQPIIRDLRSTAERTEDRETFVPDLMAYALMGAAEAMQVRIGRDPRLSARDAESILELVYETLVSRLGAAHSREA